MANLRQLFLRHLAQTSDFPLMLEIEKAEGIYLYGPDGKRYIDLISGIGVSNVGHRHPAVVDAIKSQVDKHLHVMVYGEYVQSTQVQLAAALSETMPEGLSSVYLVNSGTEAVEGALKLAKRYTNKTKLVSCVDAYHGSTHGSLSVTGNESLKNSFRPLLPEVYHIPYGSFSHLQDIDHDTAAFIVETVQGESGVKVSCASWFKTVRQRCDETGTLLILDEIQCGFGRTGTFWAFEQMGIIPDIVISAKGMGGGMPIGCFVSRPEIMKKLTNDPILGHITTFGGHPVSAAAALATIHVIQQEKLYLQVAEKAMLFRKLLVHPKIKTIRNQGLMMAVEFASFDILKPIIDLAITRGVITDWFLFCNYSMRIAPPLTITFDEIEEACAILLSAIQDA